MPKKYIIHVYCSKIQGVCVHAQLSAHNVLRNNVKVLVDWHQLMDVLLLVYIAAKITYKDNAPLRIMRSMHLSI